MGKKSGVDGGPFYHGTKTDPIFGWTLEDSVRVEDSVVYKMGKQEQRIIRPSGYLVFVPRCPGR